MSLYFKSTTTANVIETELLNERLEYLQTAAQQSGLLLLNLLKFGLSLFESILSTHFELSSIDPVQM